MSLRASKILVLAWSIAMNALFYFTNDARHSPPSSQQKGAHFGAEKTPTIDADPAPFEKKIPSRYNKRFFSECLASSTVSFQEVSYPDFEHIQQVIAPQDFFINAFLSKDGIRGPPTIA